MSEIIITWVGKFFSITTDGETIKTYDKNIHHSLLDSIFRDRQIKLFYGDPSVLTDSSFEHFEHMYNVTEYVALSINSPLVSEVSGRTPRGSLERKPPSSSLEPQVLIHDLDREMSHIIKIVDPWICSKAMCLALYKFKTMVNSYFQPAKSKSIAFSSLHNGTVVDDESPNISDPLSSRTLPRTFSQQPRTMSDILRERETRISTPRTLPNVPYTGYQSSIPIRSTELPETFQRIQRSSLNSGMANESSMVMPVRNPSVVNDSAYTWNNLQRVNDRFNSSSEMSNLQRTLNADNVPDYLLYLREYNKMLNTDGPTTAVVLLEKCNGLDCLKDTKIQPISALNELINIGALNIDDRTKVVSIP